MNSLFIEITLVLILAGAISILVSFFKQPSLLAYILTGLILGPFGLARLSHGEMLSGLAEIGITLLLFIVGLELDMRELKIIGKPAILAGLGQLFFTFIIGWGIAAGLGFSPLSGAYIAMALTFSSTIIVVKLLSEKRDTQSLYGKLAVGIFIVQDLCAIILLVGLNSISSNESNIIFGLGSAILKFLLVVGVIYLHSRYIFPKVIGWIGKNQDLLLIFSLAWALGFASLVALPFFGFNLAIGGFLAGLALANTAVHFEIIASIKPIRDFFIMIFFIVLGAQLDLNQGMNLITPTIIFSTFVLIGNPIIVLLILTGLGFKPRTAFFTGITVGQISEFSLILAALGLSLGHINKQDVAIVTLVGLTTITLSSYLILYTRKIYEHFKTFINRLDFKRGSAEKHLRRHVLKNHYILVGANRLGRRIIATLEKSGEPFVVVDFNPNVIEKLNSLNIPTICGDFTDSFIQELANLRQAKLVISTVPDLHDTMTILAAIRGSKFRTKLIVTAVDENEALRLYEKEADYVLLPHFIGADHLKNILEKKNSSLNLNILKRTQMKLLNKQEEVF